MHLANILYSSPLLFKPHPKIDLTVLSIAVILSIIVACSGRSSEEVKKARQMINKEDSRVAGLPRLITRWLLPVPDDWLGTLSPRAYSKRARARTFNLYKCYLVVYDEKGDMWVGFLMPETIRSLRAAEYVQRDYMVPLCGREQKVAGRPFDINGFHIDIYPRWLEKSENMFDLQRWSVLEQAFENQFKGGDPRKIFRDNFPTQELERFQDERDAYEKHQGVVEQQRSVMG